MSERAYHLISEKVSHLSTEIVGIRRNIYICTPNYPEMNEERVNWLTRNYAHVE